MIFNTFGEYCDRYGYREDLMSFGIYLSYKHYYGEITNYGDDTIYTYIYKEEITE